MKKIAEARKEIEAALAFADDSHSYEDIVKAVELGELQYWPGVDSIVVTELIQYPRYKTLHLFLAGGNIVELEAMLPIIERWGKSEGCDRITLGGRKGWLRSFLTKSAGYSEKLVVLEKKF